MSAADLVRDQAVRTEVLDAFQAVMADFDLLVCPTVAALPVRNADDRNTLGPGEVDGVAVDPLIGWGLTYLANFTGHPAASVPSAPTWGRWAGRGRWRGAESATRRRPWRRCCPCWATSRHRPSTGTRSRRR